ncbi:class I SAM-dependent methyltransferase [bacterium]|nr:class I SAM-dependent methyltransferase [bacterium]
MAHAHASPDDPSLRELLYGDTLRFALAHLPRPGARVLEAGCGRGILALALARRGYEVTGVDPSPEALAFARAASVKLPAPARRRLALLEIPFEEVEREGLAPFDGVIWHRALHHVEKLAPVVAATRRLLRPGGVVVCHEFAPDLFDDRAAAWSLTVEELLGSPRDLRARTLGDVRSFRDDWKRGHPFHGFRAMRSALSRSFEEAHFSWQPYLFTHLVPLLGGKRRELARAIKEWEVVLIESGAIPAVAFRFVGRRSRDQARRASRKSAPSTGFSQ